VSRAAPRAVPFLLLCAAAFSFCTSSPESAAAKAKPSRPAASAVAQPLDIRYAAAAERLIGAALADTQTYRRLSELCDGIGNRLSGSPQLARAVAWAEQAMKEDGLENVRLQAARIPHWVRGAEHAVMIEPGPVNLDLLGLGGSVGTPDGGITADVVAVANWDELKALPDDAVRGRIVLYDVPFVSYGETVRYRSSGANRAAARGAMATLLRSVGPVSLRTPHTGSTGAYVDSIPKIPCAAVTIEDATMIHRLLRRGVRVRVHLEMEAHVLPDTLSANVIGEIRGSERPEEVVVVGGHLDSWDVGAGAHDDGGGDVISMGALRLMKRLGLRPRRTVRCVLWVNEENGNRGARAYGDSAKNARERHVAAIESDGGVERLVGFGVRVNRAAASDSVDTTRTARAVALLQPVGHLLAGLGGDRITNEGGGTDIDPLMKQTVPGLAHRTTMEHYFDWHHTPADMLDKVDPIELRKNLAALAVMVYVLADMPETL
jgi:carboxypeptidase Q